MYYVLRSYATRLRVCAEALKQPSLKQPILYGHCDVWYGAKRICMYGYIEDAGALVWPIG